MDDTSLLAIFEGKPNKQKLFFYNYYADEIQTNSCHELSDTVLFRYFLNENVNSCITEKIGACNELQILREIDKESQIVQVETHRHIDRQINTASSTGSCNIFIVFQTASVKDGNFWWSFDKNVDHIMLQRSQEKDDVKNKLKGKTRKETQFITEQLGKEDIKQFLTLLWIHMSIDMKYQRYLSRCESIMPLIMKKITKKRYEYDKSDFIYSALSAEEKNPDLADIIKFLLDVSNWHPLVIAIYLGDVELFDEILQDGKYNINGIYNKFTLLNLAILFHKREMIQHLLVKTKVNPLKKDERGRNALHMAAKFNRETEITNLLLHSKIPIDLCDVSGTTALNHAIMASNTAIVRCLLEKGADPKKLDQSGRTPLHVAALNTRDTKIIDYLLKEKEKVDVNECDEFGVTALHNSAIASNIATARHLLIKGADINCRNKRGLTPLHALAFFAKDMDILELFLDNKKINLHCCDELGQNVIAYAKKNTYGLRKLIIDRLKERDARILKEYFWLNQAKSEIQIPIWNQLASFISRSPTLTENKPKLFFVPFADLKPGKGCEISETDLIRYIANEENIDNTNLTEFEIPGELNILSDIDINSKITQVQIYQSRINMVANFNGLFHFFMVFKTTSKKDGDHWWSLEKTKNYIVLQRSRDKDAVRNKLNGAERRIDTSTINNLIGKGSIKNLFVILWTYQVVQEKYQNKNSNSLSFVTFVSEQITEIECLDDSTNKNDPVVMNLIQILSFGISEWHPLFFPICTGNAIMFDKIVKEMTKFDNFDNKLTPLNLAIALPNKMEIIRHLLENHNADPSTRDGLGRNALEMAAIYADYTDIIDLLLKHKKVKINGCDKTGRTALHFAAASSNVAAARHLVKMGSKPNTFDSRGFSPLHLAAYYSDTTETIDLLLEAQRTKEEDDGIDNIDNRTDVGITALHAAAIASNDIIAEYLIKRGADPNKKDKLGRTPLHLAAIFATNINIFHVLLNDKQVDVNSLDTYGQNALDYAESNSHGLSEEIVSLLKGKCVKRRTSTNTTTLDFAIQYPNKETDQLLSKTESYWMERKTQSKDPPNSGSQSKDLQLKPAMKLKRQSCLYLGYFNYLFFFINLLFNFM